jgi:hypothetical protein
MIKNLKLILFFPFFLIEILLFKVFKIKNSELSHQALIHLFTITHGYSNNIISKFLSSPKSVFSNASNIFKKKNFFNIDQKLSSDGYYMLQNKLPENSINNILEFLKKSEGKYISENYTSLKKEKLNIKNPKAVKFNYDTNDILNCGEIQKLITDEALLQIAQNYLKAEPIIDYVTAYYSFPSLKADREAAQYWHFDMDRPKFLKVFVYLTDCTSKNGPHSFIKGSHKTDTLPKKIIKQGYQRLEDTEINLYYKKSEIINFIGGRGTVLLEDTSGLHKGKNLLEGHRLIFMVQYSSCLFGSKSEKIKYPSNPTRELIKIKKKNPKVFLNF